MKNLKKTVIINLIATFYLSNLNAMDPKKEFESSSYKLCNPSKSDIDALAVAHVKCWEEAYEDLLPYNVIQLFNFGKRKLMWTSFLTNFPDNVVVVKNFDKLVGFSSWKVNDEHHGELLTMYILKAHQKKGLGGEMLNFAAKSLSISGIKTLGLWVLTTNPAKEFYKHCGFKEIKTEKKQLGESSFYETYMEKEL